MKVNLQEQLDRAVDLLDKGKDLDTAEGIFNALLNLDKDSPAVWFYLGSLQYRRKHFQCAILLLEKSIALDGNSPFASHVWSNLGVCYREQGQENEAQLCFLKAIEIKNDFADFHANLGATYVAKGIPNKAIETLSKALELEPDNATALWNRSLALLENGDLVQGFNDYENGLRTSDRYDRNYHDNGTPLWDGTPGKNVVVFGEQGIGDEIMFASILPDLMKTCNVIFDAHPRLADMFRDSFPDIPIYGTRKSKELHWNKIHHIDAKIAIGSLPKFFRKQKEDFPGTPYLKADEFLSAKFKRRLGELGARPKIGFSWRGGIKQTNGSSRYIPLDQWLPLFELNCDFISLQYDKNTDEKVAEFEAKHGKKFHHWQDVVDDYDYTAALVSHLDLIISVPQSVVHLAGALGVPTFQLTPKKAMWQMGVYGEDMHWYSCVKNIWQDETETWEPVLNQVKEELCKLLQMNIAA